MITVVENLQSWLYILDYVPPKFKTHRKLVFELLNVGILLMRVHKTTDNTFLGDLQSMI